MRCQRHDPTPNLGKKFGRWTLLSYDGTDKNKYDHGRNPFYTCVCDCGTIRSVLWKSIKLKRSTSCGCYNKEVVKSLKHGKSFGVCARNQVHLAYKRGAMKRNLSFELTKEDFFYYTQMNCHYCGIGPSNTTRLSDSRIRNGDYPVNGEFTYNGIDRVDNNIGYVKYNCVPCCRICNLAKHTNTYSDFIKWLDNLVQFRNQLNKEN